MSWRLAAIAPTALLVAGGLAFGGYQLGHDQAPTESDATTAQQIAYQAGYDSARASARERARNVGARRGLKAGRERGNSSGTDLGASAGRADAQAQVAAAAAAQVEAQRQAALQATQERAANCGAPLFVQGYCPTNAEVQQENQAEALCGSGLPADRAEAARLGIDC